MKRLVTWTRRLRGVFWPGDSEAKLAEELESHLQLHIDDNLQRGMAPEEARRQALIGLGIERTRQAYHERSTIPAIENFLRDARFGLRSLSKSPGYEMFLELMGRILFLQTLKKPA